jgi:hypothetical protein
MPRHRVGAKRRLMTGASAASSIPHFPDHIRRHGILDHPLSRMMTVNFDAG